MSASTIAVALLLTGTPLGPLQLPQLPADAPPAQDRPVTATPSPEALPADAATAPATSSATAPTAPGNEAISAADVQDDIIVTGRHRAPPGDPLQAINIQSYNIVQFADKVAVAPAANVYKKAIPTPIRSGVRNFFNNLAEPVVFVNYLLQLKPGKAAETFGRFAINSTAGVGGLMDIAKRKPFKLPLRRNGFANTLGFYGVKPGPFLYVPLVGPTTVRDLFGLTIDKMLLPGVVGAPFNRPYYVLPATLVSSLDYRVEFDAQLKKLREAPDPYAASREAYLTARQAEIDALRGRKSKGAPTPIAPPSGTVRPDAVKPPVLPVPADAGTAPSPTPATN